MTPIYSLRDIAVRQGKDFTLEVPSLDFFPGRIYSLVGPNGAGKSTLLRFLSLLQPPAKGALHFAGSLIRWEKTILHRLRQVVTLVDQDPYLFDRTVFQNLAFGLRLRGITGAEARLRIAETLDNVGLTGFEERLARDLSGGEVRRVALARALVLHPRILLLDEPGANLDPPGLLALERLIAALPARGLTVILTTHDPAQPARLGSEVLRLSAGRVIGRFSPPADDRGRLQEKVIWLRPSKTREN